jgi:hypothetical protein
MRREDDMTRQTLGRRARRRAARTAALVAAALACSEAPREAPRVDVALARDLQLAAAAGVEFATRPSAPTGGRFLGAAEGAPSPERSADHATAVRAARRVARAAAPAPTPVVAVAAVAPVAEVTDRNEAPAPTLAPSSEPEPERIVRYAVGDGLDEAYGVGVVLRGARVGDDDKCDRELPRPRVPTATVIRSAPQVTLRDAGPVRQAGRGGMVGPALPPF